jgi:cell fate (sporulation/competence/biofilm development) regulator YlbF (YheA/YmcA/DUF963 family)
MADALDAILEEARRLGDLIRSHPRYMKLREADARVRADKSATDALEAYNRAATGIARKEQAAQPVEVGEKRALERLHNAVASNATVKAFAVAQADYAELMRKMNDAIFGAITGGETGDSDEAEGPEPDEDIPMS